VIRGRASLSMFVAQAVQKRVSGRRCCSPLDVLSVVETKGYAMSGRWIRTSAIAWLCVAVLAGVPATSAAWTQEKTKDPSTTEDALLEVSCWNASECEAVGTYRLSQPEPLAERLSGGKWKEEAPPVPTGVLNGVSCPTKEFCMASGVYQKSGKETAFADEYVSGTWSELPVTLPSSRRSEFDRVSCPTTEMCMMVGVFENSSGELLPFAEQWTHAHGVTLETTPGAAEAVLIGVSCVSTEECMAVGWTKKAVLSDRWSGGTWTQTTSASSSLSPVRLFGVDCISETVVECIGVGWGTSSGKVVTMAERWTKAGGWVASSPKNPNTTKDLLAAVGCFSGSECIGVGEEEEGPKEEALIEKLASGSWSVETPATVSVAHKGVRLLGLSCQVGGSACMAVGYYLNASGDRETLAEHN
jgi:hypothetical protein